MGWRIWITSWFIVRIRYPRLLWIYLKKHGEQTDNPSIKINVNKIGNRVTFKIKTEFYLELSTSETMKLLGSIKNQITTDEKGENVSNLEITKVLLTHCSPMLLIYTP